MKYGIEEMIIDAVWDFLKGKVNQMIVTEVTATQLPVIWNTKKKGTVVPVVTVRTCKGTKKEKDINLDAYSVKISFTIPEGPLTELHCYYYGYAICVALIKDFTLNGNVLFMGVNENNFISTSKIACDEDREFTIRLRALI